MTQPQGGLTFQCTPTSTSGGKNPASSFPEANISRSSSVNCRLLPCSLIARKPFSVTDVPCMLSMLSAGQPRASAVISTSPTSTHPSRISSSSCGQLSANASTPCRDICPGISAGHHSIPAYQINAAAYLLIMQRLRTAATSITTRHAVRLPPVHTYYALTSHNLPGSSQLAMPRFPQCPPLTIGFTIVR
jgi:hypothetical protein